MLLIVIGEQFSVRAGRFWVLDYDAVDTSFGRRTSSPGCVRFLELESRRSPASMAAVPPAIALTARLLFSQPLQESDHVARLHPSDSTVLLSLAKP
ncbi:hypothetical protein B296_00019526 [Ensete ventricosum]|uniref:Uncharacterized protein n=1 Tax=Ensete ventricosum TaxID=4639 RepID=A0A427AS39_ENSVE|nr:hypothetical protein B296_00019526 [Ensete ventricosum]